MHPVLELEEALLKRVVLWPSLVRNFVMQEESTWCLEHLKGLYEEDEDFGVLFKECQKHPKGDFLIQEGYLFKGTRLCVPKCGTRDLLAREVHGGSLAGHYKETRRQW